jgi:DNA-binding LacI/PurR family transcriptional regulator
MSKKSNITDVANLAGVSKSTVSRIARGETHYIRPETITRVRQAIAELSYRPNSVARSLVSQRTNTLALATFHFEKHDLLSDPYLAGVLSGIVDTVTPQGLFVLVYPVTDDPPATAAFLDFLDSSRVDGLILHNLYLDDPLLAPIADTKTPCIALNRDQPIHERSATVSVGGEGFSLLVDHLVQKGHRKIAFIPGNLRDYAGLAGLQTVRLALQQRGLPVRDEWIQGGQWYEAGGAAGMQRILQASERPTAVMAASDLMAIGAIEVIQAAGLRVPEDIAVTGHNDDPYAKHMKPALTTVHFGYGDVGSAAAKCLLALIDHKAVEAKDTLIPIRLVARDSA